MSILSILSSSGASSTLIEKVKQYPQLAAEIQSIYTKYEALEASERRIEDQKNRSKELLQEELDKKTSLLKSQETGSIKRPEKENKKNLYPLATFKEKDPESTLVKSFEYIDEFTGEYKRITATDPDEIQAKLKEAQKEWDDLFERNLHDRKINSSVDINKTYGIQSKSQPLKTEEEFLKEIEEEIKNLPHNRNKIQKTPKTNNRALSLKPKPVEKNSFNEFFGKMHSFDFETTGLDTESKDFNKRSLVWQVGLFTEGEKGKDIHTNPFYYFDKSSPGFIKDLSENEVEGLLRTSAGEFSEKAWIQGNFKTFTEEYLSDNLTTFSKSLEDTLGTKIKPQDVVVLQNMNFENRVLKSYRGMGLLSQNTIDRLSSRMETVSLSGDGSVLNIFERPLGVQRAIREADFLYNTQYLLSRDAKSFDKYLSLMNKSLDAYEDTILDKKRTGAVAVELMDITKATYANAASLGLMPKERVTVGLSLDFLSKALYGEPEKHTAYADAELTTKVYKDLIEMNEELRSGKALSEGTLENIRKITEAQSIEIENSFDSSIRSVLEDFNIKGKTKVQGGFNWYAPRTTLRSKREGTTVLEPTSATKRRETYNLEEALRGVEARYSIHEEGRERRQTVIEKLLKEQKEGSSYKDLQISLSAAGNLTPSSAIGISPSSKEKSILNKKFWAGAAIAGLAYSALIPERQQPPLREDNSVASEFYSEDYLGTAFVQFDNRNKHYMM